MAATTPLPVNQTEIFRQTIKEYGDSCSWLYDQTQKSFIISAVGNETSVYIFTMQQYHVNGVTFRNAAYVSQHNGEFQHVLPNSEPQDFSTRKSFLSATWAGYEAYSINSSQRENLARVTMDFLAQA